LHFLHAQGDYALPYALKQDMLRQFMRPKALSQRVKHHIFLILAEAVPPLQCEKGRTLVISGLAMSWGPFLIARFLSPAQVVVAGK
jgi:hypothetical protein